MKPHRNGERRVRRGSRPAGARRLGTAARWASPPSKKVCHKHGKARRVTKGLGSDTGARAGLLEYQGGMGDSKPISTVVTRGQAALSLGSLMPHRLRRSPNPWKLTSPGSEPSSGSG